jgi:hypothetical protein
MYIFPVLVHCVTKNLATLLRTTKKADARLPWLRQLIDLSSLSHYALHLLLQFDRSLASPYSYLRHLKVTR